jgi:hypothetical protein
MILALLDSVECHVAQYHYYDTRRDDICNDNHQKSIKDAIVNRTVLSVLLQLKLF